MLDTAPMGDMPHLLLVDDERSIREPLAAYLTKQGFRVTQAGDAESARTRLTAYAIDLVILDIMMPGEDGLSLCRHIAATSDVPVILLTARTEETDRIIGLEMGADDYVVQPFSPRELATRVKVILRRATAGGARQHAPEANAYAFAGWVLKSGERFDRMDANHDGIVDAAERANRGEMRNTDDRQHRDDAPAPAQ